ncbi:hypothetical protein C1646_696629 [Rhizophagus diaphanus]|nr:hypothetical protein C1646_696629 [Rhizophagus diaphanus] [Rhizophagus sp. MUCL 43196]
MIFDASDFKCTSNFTLWVTITILVDNFIIRNKFFSFVHFLKVKWRVGSTITI